MSDPLTGSAGRWLTFLAALGALGVMILTPLAGPAGQLTPHAAANRAAFLLAVLIQGGLAGLALRQCRRERRRGRPAPVRAAFVLLAFALLHALGALTGFFAV